MVKRRCAFVVTDPCADAQRGAECYLSALVSGHGPSGRGDACCGIIPSISLLSPAHRLCVAQRTQSCEAGEGLTRHSDGILDAQGVCSWHFLPVRAVAVSPHLAPDGARAPAFFGRLPGQLPSPRWTLCAPLT